MVTIFRFAFSLLSPVKLSHLLVGLMSKSETARKNNARFFHMVIHRIIRQTFKIISGANVSESTLIHGKVLGAIAEFSSVPSSKARITRCAAVKRNRIIFTVGIN